MDTPRFLQIHTLTSYPGTLLNRDDAGFAKRLPFGGVTRTRVSSQCLKRHWRTFDGQHALSSLDVPPSYRSRRTFARHVVAPLVGEGFPQALVEAVTEQLMEVMLGKSAAKKKKGEDTSIETSQLTVLGAPEVEYLRGEVRDVVAALHAEHGDALGGDTLKKEQKQLVTGATKAAFKTGAMKKNLQALTLASGLSAALFGRMVTSDILARGDAAIHVAHAITVHGEASETDYFTAVDDLLADGDGGELGSGHINTTELTSGLFYGYVVVDVPLLVSNLTGCRQEDWQDADRALAGAVIRSLIHTIATVSPGAKRGSTAPYARPHLLMVEAGDAQPRTLANAFLRPVSTRGDLLQNTFHALHEHLDDLDSMFGPETTSKLVTVRQGRDLATANTTLCSLNEATQWADGLVTGGA